MGRRPQGSSKISLLLKNCMPFQKKVYQTVMQIASGETRSYKWVAEKSGSPHAYRAVGQALNKNPYIGVIPCHRVIASDGSIGGFSRGVRKKRQMLKKEGIEL